jgi:hypothetical protein
MFQESVGLRWVWKRVEFRTPPSQQVLRTRPSPWALRTLGEYSMYCRMHPAGKRLVYVDSFPSFLSPICQTASKPQYMEERPAYPVSYSRDVFVEGLI